MAGEQIHGHFGERLNTSTAFVRDRVLAGRRGIWITGILIALLTWQVAIATPGTGLDLSWMSGLYMAVHDGKDFGDEIVFTYGPLGFLAWPGLWFSWLAVLAFLFSAVVFVAFSVTLVAALERSIGLLAAAVVAFFYFVTVPDLEQVPLTLAVGLCFLALREDRAEWGLTVLAVGGGLLGAFECLIKLSAGPEIFIACLIGVFGARAGRKHWALFAGSFVGGVLVLWLLAGQSLLSLWDYGVYGAQIVSGYNEAMSIGGAEVWEGVVLIGAAGGLVLATALAPFRDQRARWSATGLVAVAAFASYKYGIVRFEPYHLSLALSAMVGIWLQLPWRRPWAIPFIAATAVIAIVFTHTYPTSPRLDVLGNLTVFKDNVELALRPGKRQQISDEARAGLQAFYAIDPKIVSALQGKRVAIEPWEDAIAWAYELDWSPLPVFQNYVAYTSKLDQINAERIEDPDGPEVILRQNPGGLLPFGARSIEGRLPAWDPPEQAVATVCNFVPIRTVLSWQVLARVPDRCGAPELVSSVDAQPGEEVRVPPAGRGEMIILDLDGVTVDGFEKLRSLLWKPPIRVAVLNSGLVSYRLVPDTSGDGLIVARDPALDGTDGFEQLPQLTSIKIEGANRQLGFKFYRVRVRSHRP